MSAGLVATCGRPPRLHQL